MERNITAGSFCDKLKHQRLYEQNHLAIAIFNLFIAALNFVLNAGFVIVLRKSKYMEIPSNSLLLCLTIVDLLSGAIAQTSFAIENFLFSRCLFSKALDNFVAAVGHLFGAMSYTTVILVSLDRYIAILHPFFYDSKITRHRLLLAQIVLWLLPIPLLLFSVFHTDASSLYYTLLSFTVTGWVLAVYFNGKILTVAYNIIKSEKKVKDAITISVSCNLSSESLQDAKRKSERPKQRGRKFTMQRESRRAITTVMFIMSALVATSTPITVYSVYMLAKSENTEDYMEQIILHWAQTVSLVNGLLNPLIYCFRMKDARKDLFRMIGISSANYIGST